MHRLMLLLALAACGVPAKELPPAGYWAVGDTQFTESTCGPAPEQTAVMHAFVEHADGAFVLSWGNPWRMTDVECPYTWDWRFVCPAGDGVPYGDDRARRTETSLLQGWWEEAQGQRYIYATETVTTRCVGNDCLQDECRRTEEVTLFWFQAERPEGG